MLAIFLLRVGFHTLLIACAELERHPPMEGGWKSELRAAFARTLMAPHPTQPQMTWPACGVDRQRCWPNRSSWQNFLPLSQIAAHSLTNRFHSALAMSAQDEYYAGEADAAADSPMKLELEAQAIAELDDWQPAGGGRQHADDAKSEDSADDIPPDAAAYFGTALALPAEAPATSSPASPHQAAAPSTPGARRSPGPEDFSWTDPTAIAAAQDEILQLKSQLRSKDKAIAQLEEAVLAATPASGTTTA